MGKLEQNRSYLEKNRAKVYAQNKKTYQEKREFVDTWKSTRGCAVCGEKDPRVLDLDHIDRDSFRDHYSTKNLCYLGWKTLMAELEKNVQVLCANCHRRKTYDNGDYEIRG